MKIRALFVGVAVAGATIAAASYADRAPGPSVKGSMPAPAQPVPRVAPKSGVNVQIISVTLGDDCGRGTAPAPKVEKAEAAPAHAPSAAPSAMPAPGARMADSAGPSGFSAKRACQPTSMRLSIFGAADAGGVPVVVKQVELYEKGSGRLVATLTPKAPTAWSAAGGSYESWDGKAKASTDIVASYETDSPQWSAIPDRMIKVYTLKVVVTVGGTDRTVEREATIYVEASLPPGVVT